MDGSSAIDTSTLLAIVLRFVWLPLLPSDLGFPALDDGLYLQSAPHAKHRAHIGRAFEHLTFARKQPSHEALRRDWRGFMAGVATVVLEEEASKR